MLDFAIVFGAIFGLAFLIKESDGPWGVMSMARSFLMTNRYVGVFFFKLLECYFCLGFHCGWFVYLLHEDEWKFSGFLLWGLAGGVICLIMDGLLALLSTHAQTIPPND